MSTLQDAAKCPCSRADEETDGDTAGHWLMVRRETLVDYSLHPMPTGLPSDEDLVGLLHADDADAAQEAHEVGGFGLWTVTCERRCEDGAATQATTLREALKMWFALWPDGVPV